VTCHRWQGKGRNRACAQRCGASQRSHG
jgi:hypothetical protein